MLTKSATGPGIALRYADSRMKSGFALSEDLPLKDQLFLPPSRQQGGQPVYRLAEAETPRAPKRSNRRHWE